MKILNFSLSGNLPSDSDALALADCTETKRLMSVACKLRDQGFQNVVSYSRKVFIPLTQLCRNVCHYCAFTKEPETVSAPFMGVDEVLKIARDGKKLGCKEALFTLGERPELEYPEARRALEDLGFKSTLEYLSYLADLVYKETGLLPHINAGCMDDDEINRLKGSSVSLGLMLESASTRLCDKGMPHHGSPDKIPQARLDTIRQAGEAKVPFTSGILIGIGETRRERIEALLALRALHQRYGHIQEIIIQNFRAKAGTKMAGFPEPSLEDLLWTIAVARIIFGAKMSIQAPPNLSPDVFGQLISAGINDWGGVSPVTRDFVNPEAPWPQLDLLARETEKTGKYLQERLAIYPQYALDGKKWLDPAMQSRVLKMTDAEGYPRENTWVVGDQTALPSHELELIDSSTAKQNISAELQTITKKACSGEALTEKEIIRLFRARGPEFAYVCQQANQLRRQTNGDEVSYVVTCNINFTNACIVNCNFCAYCEKESTLQNHLDHSEIARQVKEAWNRGATEVCLQGGIHPDYTGTTYLDILKVVREVCPDIHIHAFSPHEIWHGAKTLGCSLEDFLGQLQQQGLGSIPGTAAEILDDEVRSNLCPNKINTEQWFSVMEAAHRIGLKTTSTIMFGHVDRLEHWARHLMQIRDLQCRTNGFTEFVILPFVAAESPIFLNGLSKKGPTFREAVLMHAVARLALNPHITNIQTSWTKMGDPGAAVCLNAGANDIGGTLMNESISRSAGASHGQGRTPQMMETLIHKAEREPVLRTTLYGKASEERRSTAFSKNNLFRLSEVHSRLSPDLSVLKQAL